MMEAGVALMRNISGLMFAAQVFALVAAPGISHAGEFKSSVSFTTDVPTLVPNFFTLPQYSGSGTISKVNLTIEGVAGGDTFYPYDPQYGITVASFPVSWDVALYGPGADGPAPPIALDPKIATEFNGGSIPGCGDPSCGGTVDAVFGPTATSFYASGDLADLSDFKGAGDNSFFVLDGSSFDINFLSVTVTETISTVPEPATWTTMLMGFIGVGGLIRGRRAHWRRQPT
jgi:hypothetical protein